jgi:hypothetical protein
MIINYLVAKRKPLMFFLIGIVLLLGFSNMYHIKKIDKNYSALLESNNHNNNLVLNSIVYSNNGLLALLKLSNNKDKTELNKVSSEIETLHKKNNEVFSELEFLNKTAEASLILTEVKKLRARMVAERKVILDLMKIGNWTEAKQKTEGNLTQDVLLFNSKQTEYIRLINEGSFKSSSQFSDDVKFILQQNNLFFLLLTTLISLLLFFKLK